MHYLSEMRQTCIVFMNLVLNENEDTESLLQKIFELVYNQTKSMQGQYAVYALHFTIKQSMHGHILYYSVINDTLIPFHAFPRRDTMPFSTC